MKKFYSVIISIFFLCGPTYSQLPGASPAIGITVAGRTGTGLASVYLSFPTDAVVDATGNIYIADREENRIIKLAPGSRAVTVAGGNGYGSEANQLSYPSDIFVDAAGNIYICDAYAHRIQKWAPGASQGITVAGGNGTGSAANQLHYPEGVYVDAGGNIYVADRNNSRVQKWAPGAAAGVTVAGGNGQGSAANQFLDPQDVFADSTGNIYVADSWNHRIQKWAPGATAGSTVAGGNGPGSAANQLLYPAGVSVDNTGKIYIADNYNHRIQKWVPGASSGITVAGGNGPGPSPAELNYPTAVFADQKGSIYVADQVNHRIQKFNTSDVGQPKCLPDLVFAAPSCLEKAIISWAEPRDTFPASFSAPQAPDPVTGTYSFMGALNGHGYYLSNATYLWSAAKTAAASTGVNGYLVTINSAEENNLIYNRIKISGHSPWIGLSNTGKPGRFRLVNREPLSYTNWAPGEPNNFGGSRRNITEPFVRMIDTSGAWNDQRDDYLNLIVEFDKPLIRNKQISGPKNGSNQKPGVYRVCYEKRNLITENRDTCCFTITVTCDSTLITQAASVVPAHTPASEKISKGLRVTTSPNPGNHTFRLNITSDNNDKISLQVTDELGRVLETRNGLTPNQTLLIGPSYRPGIYFAQVMQGNRITTVRLIKKPE